MVYCPSNLMKNRASSELLPLEIGWDVGRTPGECVNHSPAARDLRIFLVFYQDPAWFISL